ncbi:two-component system, NarL family, sensor histidine kinase EvgS [Microdochium nivale]|nr:two-component system, NarL family, sensor histidine kinase EvgS [Microdochium nivale]
MHSQHRTAICACYPDLDNNGEVDSMMIFMMDISELKWTEEQLLTKTKELEKSEGKYRNHADHCPFGIVRTDSEGYVQFGNAAWHDFYDSVGGVNLSKPQPWLPHIKDEDVEPCLVSFRKLQRHCGPEAVEFRLREKAYIVSEGDRTISNDAWVLATGFSAFNDDGTVDYIDFWVVDISAQKLANKVLTEKMEEALQLKTHQERFIDMISHEIRNPLSAVLHRGEEVAEAMANASAVLDVAQSFAKIAPQWEMSKTALKAHIASAHEAANTVLYCVQHQKQIVDDVLTMSKLDSSLLEVSPIPVQPTEFIQTSLKIFERELKMTDIKLILAEDESLQQHALDWILLDPNRYLQIVINLVTNAIKFTKNSDVRKITMTLAVTTERPLPKQLGVDYVPHRYAEAPIDKRRSSTPEIILPEGTQNDVFLSLSVADTGKGMTESERAMLFQRFAQASPKTHIEYGGSGLGLFISRQITEMLGGEIGMSSRPGIGSTFSFYVRAQRIPPQAGVSAKPDQTAQMKFTINQAPISGTMTPPQVKEPFHSPLLQSQSLGGSSRRVLVVEDNLINQKVLCKQLRNHNFIVQAANHGRQALEALLKNPGPRSKSLFDVILCDVEMPVMGGLEFAVAVRNLEKKGILSGHVPIIGVTANVRQNQVAAAIESGMDGVTTKPYRIFELIEHIDRLAPLSSNSGKHNGANGDVVTQVLELSPPAPLSPH